MKRQPIPFVRLVMILTGAAFAVHAEDAAPARPWKNTLDASVVSTNGNTKTTSMAAKNTFAYNWTRSVLELIVGGLGAEENGSTTAEQYTASEKYLYKFTEKNYVFERVSWDNNRFAGYYHRYDGTAGLGRYLMDLPKHQWNAEFSGGYAKEQRVVQPDLDNSTGRAYTKYLFNFTPTSSFSQDVEYIHNFDDADAYRMNTESVLRVAMSTRVALRVGYVWNRVAKPAPGAVKDDTRFTTGLQFVY